VTSLARITDALATPKTRRSVLTTLAGLGAGAMVATTAGPAFANHTAQTYTVSSNANFRSGPGTTYSIISVISKGATFMITGLVQNGYAQINYQSKTGWVLASLVVAAGGATTSPDPVIVGKATTTSAVNLRSGPSTSNSVLRVVPAGATVQISSTVQNGYRYVTHDGLAGWIADQYLKPAGTAYNPVPATMTTTANVNLRAEPSTSAKILLVIPAGAKVVPNGSAAYNFAQVTYNGVKGWVAMAYLT
jgi:uncharacterized protein YgiM (DUF1202 family)